MPFCVNKFFFEKKDGRDQLFGLIQSNNSQIVPKNGLLYVQVHLSVLISVLCLTVILTVIFRQQLLGFLKSCISLCIFRLICLLQPSILTNVSHSKVCFKPTLNLSYYGRKLQLILKSKCVSKLGRNTAQTLPSSVEIRKFQQFLQIRSKNRPKLAFFTSKFTKGVNYLLRPRLVIKRYF